jgi:hypothetical protein
MDGTWRAFHCLWAVIEGVGARLLQHISAPATRGHINGPTAGFDPGCVKTGLSESFMRGRRPVRIYLLPERPAKSAHTAGAASAA